jgi:NAD(P)-dependent dehydrogenase (short-subunit alcohol dehydrogenase family)
MTTVGKTVPMTGANRGSGQALVEEVLSRDVDRVYAGTRRLLTHIDPRVSPISKGAAFSLSQSLRALVTGPADTDMCQDLDIPKAAPWSVARAIFDRAAKPREDIFPDPTSQAIAQSWRSGAAKALERQCAALVKAEPVT